MATAVSSPPPSDSQKSTRVALPWRHRLSSAPNDDSSTAPAPLATLEVELRWGIQAEDLRRIWHLHRDGLPVLYNVSYYQWLQQRDSCVALLAFVKDVDYQKIAAAYDLEMQETGEREPKRSHSNEKKSSANLAADGLPLSVLHQVLSDDEMKEELEVGLFIDATESWPKSSSTAASPFTVAIGMVIGQLGYAIQHQTGRHYTNPVAYIGNYAVDSPFRRLGVGEALLKEYMAFFTHRRPLCTSDYLHYNEQQLIAMVAAQRDVVEQTKKPATPPPGEVGEKNTRPFSSPRREGKGIIQQVVEGFFPEVMQWMRRREQRRELQRQGLSDDAIERSIARAEAADPDAITDVEAESLRQTARQLEIEKGVSTIWLNCMSANEPLVRFYEKRGFRKVSRQENFYSIAGASYDSSLLVYVTPKDGDEVLESVATEAEAVSPVQNSVDSSSTVELREKRTQNQPAAVVEAEPTKKSEAAASSSSTSAAASGAAQHTPSTPASLLSTSLSHTSAWVSRDNIEEVEEISLAPASELRCQWQEEWHQDRARRRGVKENRTSLMSRLEDTLLLCNAFAVLGVVLYLSYHYGVTGKA